MVTGKILEVRDELSVSGQHMNLYFKNRNWQAECVALKERSYNNLHEWLPYVQEGALMLRVEPEESQVVLDHFPRLPTHVNWLATADSLVFESKEWWPRLYLYDSLRTVVVSHFRELDIGLEGYVVGANRMGRAAVAALAGLGFSKISLVDEDEDKIKAEAAYLSRYLFGVRIEGVPSYMLTEREAPGSMTVNTKVLPDNSTVLTDLSYFNFMKTGGVVIDISECTSQNTLLQEAERADLKTMSGLVVQSHRDVDILKKLFPQQYITHEDYLESFGDNLPSLKNPSSV